MPHILYVISLLLQQNQNKKLKTMMKKTILLLLALASFQFGQAADAVKLTLDAEKRGAEITNGLFSMTINPEGSVTAIRYAGEDILVGGQDGTAYLSYVTDQMKNGLKADATTVVNETPDQVEIVYSNSRESRSLHWSVGYIVRKGVPGYYTYAVVKARETSKGKFDNGLHEARLVYRMNPDIFNYVWVNDNSQSALPSNQSFRNPVQTIQDATFLLDDGQIYTKYDWSAYVKDDQLHGLMGDKIGAWLVQPTVDWVNGGVQKQELTVHGDVHSPLLLQMWQSCHFGGLPTRFEREQLKFYGPGLMYFNQGSREQMIADAKKRLAQEEKAYPYQWLKHDLFPLQRGQVKGRITIDKAFGTNTFRVILAKPGSDPMSQGDSYQYWAVTDSKGNFTIDKVRPGEYALYTYALNGEATGYYEHDGITVKVGKNDVGTINWNLEKYGTTLWRIGEADHYAKGYKFSDRHRAYGVCKEVPEDLTFTIGKSKESEDWYYAQTKNGYWNILFNIDQTYTEPLRLTIAHAAAAGRPKENVLLNGKDLGLIRTENDGSVYRSAILSGRYTVHTFDIDPKDLNQGENKLAFKLWGIPEGNLGGIMYDIIKLEAKK